MIFIISFVFLQVDSCWEFIGLLPYRDDLRRDSAEAVESLIDLGLDIRVLTGGHSDVHILFFRF